MERERELERIQSLLAKIGKKPLKSYGQNFLVERKIAKKISENVPEKHLDHILEIGPGLGVLTGYLLERGAKVTAIEKDPILAETLFANIDRQDTEALDVICDDAIKVLDRFDGKDHYIVSNLPFNISSRLMGNILDRTDILDPDNNSMKGGLIMFQEEFSRRLTSDHGSKEYGRISVMFRTKMRFQHIMDVGSSSFYPPPKVNASVIKFEPKYDHDKVPVDMKLFSDLVHVTFLNRRKKMRNSVNPRSLGMLLEMEDTRWLLDDMGISDLRPEDLPPEIFVELSNRLASLK